MEFTFTEGSIKYKARKLWKAGNQYKVWAFHGEMGSGKTTFIHALCTILGSKSVMGSPTYAIINEYAASIVKRIFHMDWYRLKNEEEALMAGVEDTLYSNELCLIEWPERAISLLPSNCLHIYLEVINDNLHKISVPALH